MIKCIPVFQPEINIMYRHCMCLLPTHSHTLMQTDDGRIRCSCKDDEAKGEI